MKKAAVNSKAKEKFLQYMCLFIYFEFWFFFLTIC